MGRPHAHPHQHLIVHQRAGPGVEQNSLWRHLAQTDEPVPAMDHLVLHCDHERVDDRKGHIPVGEALRREEL